MTGSLTHLCNSFELQLLHTAWQSPPKPNPYPLLCEPFELFDAITFLWYVILWMRMVLEERSMGFCREKGEENDNGKVMWVNHSSYSFQRDLFGIWWRHYILLGIQTFGFLCVSANF